MKKNWLNSFIVGICIGFFFILLFTAYKAINYEKQKIYERGYYEGFKYASKITDNDELNKMYYIDNYANYKQGKEENK